MRWLTSRLEFVRQSSAAELTLGFALGTFQASLLVVLGALIVFRRGGSFEDLDTVVGSLLFLWLWLTSCYWTLEAVKGIGVETLAGAPLEKMLSEGIVRGAQSGAVFFAGVLAALFLLAGFGLSDDGGALDVLGLVLFGAVYLTVGCVVAAVVGGAAGFVFAVTYRMLLQAARLLSPV